MQKKNALKYGDYKNKIDFETFMRSKYYIYYCVYVLNMTFWRYLHYLPAHRQ